MEASSDLLLVPRVGWQRSRAWVQGEEREGKKEFRWMGKLMGKEVSLHSKKGLGPSLSQVTGIEACRKLTKRQRKTSRCWSLSGLGDCILDHKLLDNGGWEHYYKLFPKQFMVCYARQEHRSDGPFIYWLHFFYVPQSQFCNYKKFLEATVRIYPFAKHHFWDAKVPSLRCSIPKNS